ncbi:MAG: tetratricopeptide repeat protein [Taibaiella sp.]|nr:tetratricopeptide repeat protein [Taibaiella sp.]
MEEKRTIGDAFKGYRRLMGWLLAICLFVYGNTLSNDYVMDDLALITRNTFVQDGLKGLDDIWAKPTLRGFDLRPVFDTAASNDIYRPLATSTFAIEHEVFGDNPGIGHLVNVLLFAACVLLLFRFVDELTGRKHTAEAFLTAAFFAVHPIHTEVVANIKSRDELLCFLFSFLALLQMLKYYKHGKVANLVSSALLLFFSLLAKETSASFILIIPIVAMFSGAGRGRMVSSTSVALAIVAAYIAIRWSVLHAWNADHPDMLDFIENPLVGAGSASARYGTALAVMARYLWLLLFPYPLSSDYTFATIPFSNVTSAISIVSILFYSGLIAAAVVLWRHAGSRIFAFGIIFFLATIALFTNLAFLTGSIMAERFLFFPSLGFCIVLSFGLHRLLAGRPRLLQAGIPAVICLIYAPLTMARNADWRTNDTLVSADAATHPKNARLHHSLAYVLVNDRMAQSVNAAERNELAMQAREHFLQSLEIYPKQSKVHTDYANLLAQMGRYDSAEAHILRALQLRPGDPVIISMLGGLYFARGRYDKTLEYCRQAQKYAPNDNGIVFNMSMCHMLLKQYDSVIYLSQLILARDPENKNAKNNLQAAKDSIAKQVSLQEPVKTSVRE